GGASARAYVFGGSSSRDDANGALSAWILGGRLEGCPVAFGNGAVSVSPCLGLDLGTLSAHKNGANTATDQGIWGAAEAAARLSVKVTGGVSVEAQASAVVPFARYELASEQTSAPLYVASPVGSNLAAGLGFRLP